MSCSKDSTLKYMIEHMLVKPNMELYTTLPSSRLIDTIATLTAKAKTKYGVDMGDLFRIRSRDISIGNYSTMGQSSIVTKIKIEPNDTAFEAIDRSKAQIENDLKEQSAQQIRKQEVENIQKEGNYIVSEEGDIVIPDNLPQINIKC